MKNQSSTKSDRGVGRVLGTAIRLAGRRSRERGAPRSPGAPPGIERAPEVDKPPAPGKVSIRCIDYGAARVESRDVEHLDPFLGEPRPDWAMVRWINVDGLHPYTINRFREHYDFHTLAAEDILHVPQRSKQESYGNHLFIVLHMLMRRDEDMLDEQVSIVFFPDTVITFQERAGDVWEPIRRRIEAGGSRLRGSHAGYLVYTLLDGVVDQWFPILEHYGDAFEAIEERVAHQPKPAQLHELHVIKRDLVQLRRVMWPMRQTLDELYRSEFEGIDEHARTYLRDVHDHVIRAIEIVETYREMANGITDLYMSSVSNRMNEIMKVLTIMASLFIPVTFLAGVYGMNFHYLPELGWRWAYPAFWGICLLNIGGLLIYFRRKGWIGNR